MINAVCVHQTSAPEPHLLSCFQALPGDPAPQTISSHVFCFCPYPSPVSHPTHRIRILLISPWSVPRMPPGPCCHRHYPLPCRLVGRCPWPQFSPGPSSFPPQRHPCSPESSWPPCEPPLPFQRAHALSLHVDAPSPPAGPHLFPRGCNGG